MSVWLRTAVAVLGCAVAMLWVAAGTARAVTLEQAQAMSRGTPNERIDGIRQAVRAAFESPADGDDRAAAKVEKLADLLQAIAARQVRTAGSTVFLVQDGRAVDALTGESVALPEGAEDVRINNRMRAEIAQALAGLQLLAADAGTRLAAVDALAGNLNDTNLAWLALAQQRESDPVVAARIALASARVRITDPDPAVRLAAAADLARSDSLEVRQLLRERLATVDGLAVEPDAGVRQALDSAYGDVEHRVFMSEIAGTLFAGISLGSILLLAALGLAITYGLMGVINLAHGELIMIGAYATYWAQTLFRQGLPPDAFDYYLWAAVPFSFVVAFLVGVLLERLVIRFLYGRSLETLLATWGISLILMQSVRNLFGAQNVAVENPSWMSGGLRVSATLVLPFNRIAIIVFAALVLVAVLLLVLRTRLGLWVRATTQNREMAQCVGVPTRRTDTLAFGLGAGLAGLAGCALSQIGNVGPDLGQSYIVDSFLVVVVGGVGQVAGAVVAALGLGVFNKILEDMSGAVIAKILLLVAVIVFIQKRPQGLFALRGRSVES